MDDRRKDSKKLTGRKYGFFEEYMMDDAEVALVVIGSSAGTGKEAVDRLRAEGKKVGLIKLRVFRPFPRSTAGGSHVQSKSCGDQWTRLRVFRTAAARFSMKRRSSLYDLPEQAVCNQLHLRSGRQRYHSRGLLRDISTICSIINRDRTIRAMYTDTSECVTRDTRPRNRGR